MMDAEKRLRLAAESLNREALGFDADAFTSQLLVRLGIGDSPEGCAGDTALRAGRTPAASPETGGRRRHDCTTRRTEFFELELEELKRSTTLHTEPRKLRRIAELTEFLAWGEEESRGWWIRAAAAGDALAALTVEEWSQSDGTERWQTPRSDSNRSDSS
jgi:hypothetical protein